MNLQKNCVSPCNGCPTPGDCIITDGCEAAALAVPTYYVRHPDGTYSAANPQPRYVGPHTPTDTPRIGAAKVADTAEHKAAADPDKEAVALDLARWLRQLADSGEASWAALRRPDGLPRRRY